MEPEPPRGKVPKRWPGFRIYLGRESRLKWKIQVLEDEAQEISQIHPSEYTRRTKAAYSLHRRYQVLEPEITRCGLERERYCVREIGFPYPGDNPWFSNMQQNLLLDKLLKIRKDAVILAIQQLSGISDVWLRGAAWSDLQDEIQNVDDHAKRSKALLFKSKPIYQMDRIVRDRFSHKFWEGLIDLYTTKVLWELNEDAIRELEIDADIQGVAGRDYWRRCEEQEAERGEKM